MPVTSRGSESSAPTDTVLVGLDEGKGEQPRLRAFDHRRWIEVVAGRASRIDNHAVAATRAYVAIAWVSF